MALIMLPHGLLARGLTVVGIAVGGVGMTVGWSEARQVALTAGEAAGGVVGLVPEFFDAGMSAFRDVRDQPDSDTDLFGTGPGGSDPDLFGTDEPGVPVPANHDH